jgi:hypothetical protein
MPGATAEIILRARQRLSDLQAQDRDELDV